MRDSARVLVVDDDPLVQEFLREALARLGHDGTSASNGEEGLSTLTLDPPDLVLLDIRMKGRDGLALLPEFRQLAPDAPVLMMTGHGTLESAVQAMRLGAFDYLTKPFSAEAIELAVTRALSVGALRRENANLRGRLSLHEALTGMVGRSRAMEDLRGALKLIAPSRSTVLISGESGTGKELVARAIHEGSPRAAGAFIKINCAAVPSGLLESELFGHEKGAFTGAVGQSHGKFEQAHGGTLLLDEISEMDLNLQPKLLRALQEREFYRVGGSKAVQVDVRVVATTNTELRSRIRQGIFREDLYYRLNVVPVSVPRLRDRREDIPALAQSFLARFALENGRGNLRIGRAAIDALLRWDWPGNVRELMNAVERAVILCAGEELLPGHFVLEADSLSWTHGPEALPAMASGLEFDRGFASSSSAGAEPGAHAALPAAAAFGRSEVAVPRDTLHEREKAWLLRVLQEESGNRTRAARRLGVSVRTVRNKLAQYAREHASGSLGSEGQVSSEYLAACGEELSSSLPGAPSASSS